MSNVTELHQCKASAVPSVPKTITATQRLAALEHAQRLDDASDSVHDRQANLYLLSCVRDAVKTLRQLAGDAKGER